MIVSLNKFELFNASMVGCRRRLESLYMGGQHQHGLEMEESKTWNMNVEGAAAEAAVAKATGLYWDGSVNTFKRGGDVMGMEVRSSDLTGASLIVRPDDSPNGVFILVIGEAPRFDVIGWISGKDAMQEKWFTNKGNPRPKAYFVPQDALNPIEELKEARFVYG